jgi:hypothetical protein
MITLDLRKKISSKSSVEYKDSIAIGENLRAVGVSAHKLCAVCHTHTSSYCCPSCFIPYCTAKCYQSHNSECTEIFYKHRVDDVLQLEKHVANQDHELSTSLPHKTADRRAASEPLPGSESSSSDDEYEDDQLHALAERLKADDYRIENITADELILLQQQVQARKNRLTKEISLSQENISWKPWFEGGDDMLIASIDYPESLPYRWDGALAHMLDVVNERLHLAYERNLKALPMLRNEHIYHIFAMLASYAILLRLYQDNLYEGANHMSEEFIASFIYLSGSLEPSFHPQSLHEVIEAITHRSARIPGMQRINNQRLIFILRDVLNIISTSSYASYTFINCWRISRIAATDDKLSMADSNLLLDALISYYERFSMKPAKIEKKRGDVVSHEMIGRKLYFFLLLTSYSHGPSSDPQQLSYQSCLDKLRESIQSYIKDYLQQDSNH